MKFKVGDTYLACNSEEPNLFWTFQIIFVIESFAVAIKINKKGFLVGSGQIIFVDGRGREINPSWGNGFYFFKKSRAKCKNRIAELTKW